MLDKFLEVGSGFDWISPLLGFLGDAMNGPSHTFLIPYDSCPMSGRDIARLLRRRGVKSWGLMIVSGTLMVSVRLAKARWAQHLLEQAGVPIENPLPEKARARSARRGRAATRSGRGKGGSQRRSESGSLVDAVTEILKSPLI
ncbi:MAG: hypothetical protein GWN58_24230 [Anaerolineae bacterium]|nr:hypothetical protein [Anaerolineae bacterium]